VNKKICWIQQLHFGNIDTNRFPEAQRMYWNYKAKFLLSPDASYITPKSYTYSNAPSANYPDPGSSKLSNMITGDPTRYTDPQWVGISGNTVIVLDLNIPSHVSWIDAHFFHNSGLGISFPSSLVFGYSNTTSNWITAGSFNLPVPNQDSEYVFGNTSPFNFVAMYIRLEIANTAWTFISEIEIVG